MLTNLMSPADVQEEQRKKGKDRRRWTGQGEESKTMASHAESVAGAGGGEGGGVWCRAMVERRGLAACQQQGKKEGGLTSDFHHNYCQSYGVYVCMYTHTQTHTCMPAA